MMKRQMISFVQLNMKRSWLPFALLTLTLIACGGAGTGTGTGAVAGLVLDANGDPVRGAKVFFDGETPRETTTNSSGSFALTQVPASDLRIKASLTDGSVAYYGENVIRVFNNEQVSNCNITMLRTNQIAKLVGRVTTSRGVAVQGARISAKPTDNSIFLTSQTITDSNGNYTLGGLFGGKPYQIMASSPGFASSEQLRTPTVGANLTQNFILGGNSDPRLPKPLNFSVTAWTSPSEISRDRELSRTYDAVKRAIDKRYKPVQSKTRLTAGGNPVEIQLFWDRIDSLQLLGFNVYRARSNDNYQNIEFLADPLGDAFLDSDPALRDGVNYFYVVNAANTNFPDTSNSEGPDSDVAQVTPLGDMNDLGVSISAGKVTFRWQTVSGASNYTTYVFDRYPSIGVQSFANNFNNPSTGNTFTYNLATLTSGVRYYYLIMGANANDSARTLSRIGSFIAP